VVHSDSDNEGGGCLVYCGIKERIFRIVPENHYILMALKVYQMKNKNYFLRTIAFRRNFVSLIVMLFVANITIIDTAMDESTISNSCP
jgi:hypothetical protein